ncbi:hypothetical protein [Mycolicibacterium sp. XJ1819]
MRRAIIVTTVLLVGGLIGIATVLFRPSAGSEPLQPITVEAPAVEDTVPPGSPTVVPDAASQVLPPPPVVDDVPPPPPAVEWDDDDDDDDDDD